MSSEVPTVLVGRKPAIYYVTAVIYQFNAGSREVKLRARGRAISTAVTVAEMSKRVVPNVKVEKIEIGTEMLGDPPRPVSTMEILLVKEE